MKNTEIFKLKCFYIILVKKWYLHHLYSVKGSHGSTKLLVTAMLLLTQINCKSKILTNCTQYFLILNKIRNTILKSHLHLHF